ncbi:MAG: excinuclease ABC subunit UvrC [Bacteroidales bacterium]|jgi:excinuclease ABC subunit C|nr:excinuclease ABC subunit UvrC [Bacteroidales bacterium]
MILKKEINDILQTLVETPGVYQFFDSKGEIIYIGKAKNLKSRVSSYFRNDASHSSKTKLLVRRINDIKTIHVSSETEALLLECNLIKEYRPRYNILLKDDKSFPWIKITNEEYPRIFFTRNKTKDGSYYFGPYTSKRHLKELMDLIREIFKYRTCSLPLKEKTVKQGKFKPCLNYQIKLCDAPCADYQSLEEYNKVISSIKNIIKGNFSDFIKEMKKDMFSLAQDLEFERAEEVKEKIRALESYKSRSSVVSSMISDTEVYAYVKGENSIFMNALRVNDGNLVSSFSSQINKKLEETDNEAFITAIIQIRDKLNWNSKEIILENPLDIPKDYVNQTIPMLGEKKKLLELSLHNAKLYYFESVKKASLVDPERNANRILETIKKDLRLETLPRHIECFDNSNTQGNQPVAACVVFRNAKPSNRDYKHYNIKTVIGPDDFASMKEVMLRRYSRLKSEGKPMPQLIVIDGGKGQLSSAYDILKELQLEDKIRIIGIAKRLEEIFFPNENLPLLLDKRSETLKVIQHIRDEAHRFGITHHRKKRSKASIKTLLTDIPGIGEASSKELLIKFTSVKKISQTSEEELAEVIGKSKARIVFLYFNQNKT